MVFSLLYFSFSVLLSSKVVRPLLRGYQERTISFCFRTNTYCSKRGAYERSAANEKNLSPNCEATT